MVLRAWRRTLLGFDGYVVSNQMVGVNTGNADGFGHLATSYSVVTDGTVSDLSCKMVLGVKLDSSG